MANRNTTQCPACGTRGCTDCKPLDDFTATGLAEGWIEGDAEQVRAAWQYLHSTGLAYRLQGWFGRTAQTLLAAKEIEI